jgi:hypothetical protein
MDLLTNEELIELRNRAKRLLQNLVHYSSGKNHQDRDIDTVLVELTNVINLYQKRS